MIENVIRLVLVLVVLTALVLIIWFATRLQGCLQPDPPVPTTALPSIPVKPPLVSHGTVAVPDQGGIKRLPVRDASSVEAVISVPPSDTATALLVDKVGTGWFPGFTMKPGVRIRQVGSQSSSVVIYQKPPLMALELKPMLGASYDGTVKPLLSVGVARVWGFHLGASVRVPTDGSFSLKPDLSISVEVVDHLHLGTGVLDALIRQPSISISYSF